MVSYKINLENTDTTILNTNVNGDSESKDTHNKDSQGSIQSIHSFFGKVVFYMILDYQHGTPKILLVWEIIIM